MHDNRVFLIVSEANRMTVSFRTALIFASYLNCYRHNLFIFLLFLGAKPELRS